MLTSLDTWLKRRARCWHSADRIPRNVEDESQLKELGLRGGDGWCSAIYLFDLFFF